MDIKPRVEALLYATEAPISISDMAIMLSAEKDDVVKALKKLNREYRSMDSALEIVRNGFRYKLQLRREYVPDVTPVTGREFESDELKALGYIAMNAETIRGDLKNLLGIHYTDTLDKLKKKGMVYSRKYRNTDVYQVTRKFYEYFDISKGKLKSLINEKRDDPDDVK